MKSAGGDEVLLLDLVLELGHPAQLAEARHRRQQPIRLRVRGHVALARTRSSGRGRARSRRASPRGRASTRAQLVGVVGDGDRVQVDDAEERRRPVPAWPRTGGSRRSGCRGACCRSAGCRRRSSSFAPFCLVEGTKKASDRGRKRAKRLSRRLRARAPASPPAPAPGPIRDVTIRVHDIRGPGLRSLARVSITCRASVLRTPRPFRHPPSPLGRLRVDSALRSSAAVHDQQDRQAAGSSRSRSPATPPTRRTSAR